jgi:cyclic pyranopterin phosphate synthase
MNTWPLASDRLQPPSTGPLVDRFGREVRKLRISVTDRCDLRCVYCMPSEGLPWKQRSELLTLEELARVAQVAVSLGVRKLRLTGGEPLVRTNLSELVRLLCEIPELADVSLTTNGVLLATYGHALAEAGLGSVNISLDSLDRARFAELTRRDAFVRVMAGIELACELWPGRVKLNAVSLRGITDLEVFDFCELARRKRLIVRFIEVMPLDADRRWSSDRVLAGQTLRELIELRYPLRPARDDDPNAPAREYRFADLPMAGIGFIDPVSEPFCGRCDRIRITADGKLRACLFAVEETDLREPLRVGATDQQLAALMRAGVWGKQAGHAIGDAHFVPASRSMSQIGG